MYIHFQWNQQLEASIYYPNSSKEHCRDTEDHMNKCQYKDENM